MKQHNYTALALYKHKIAGIPDHYSGKCTQFCTHEHSHTNKQILTDPACISYLCEALHYYIELAQNYLHVYSSNGCEATNKAISQKIPKDKHQPKAYDGKVDLAIATKDLGPNSLLTMQSHTSIPISQSTKTLIEKRQQYRVKHLGIQKTTTAKQKRKKKKIEAKKLSIAKKKIKSQQACYSYKGICGCKGGCSNKRCGCFKLNKGCTDSCNCVNCNNQLGKKL
jgi:hypothetical protein